MRATRISACIAVWYLAVSFSPAWAAVGCSLNDPDRDIRRIFPDASGYRTEFMTIKKHGGDSLAEDIEMKLRDTLDPVYESIDVPYAYYTVLKGKETIGRVHGVNQKGKYGGMQLILATDPDGIVIDFYYQRISSPESKRFRGESFTDQFRGLTLADFYRHNILPEDGRTGSPVGRIGNPTEKSAEDFAATLRGVMKNLILLDEFKLDNKHYRLVQEEEEKGNERDGK